MSLASGSSTGGVLGSSPTLGGDPPVIYQYWHWPAIGSPTGPPFVSTFEFLAERLTEDEDEEVEFVLGFYGSANLQ